MIQQFYFSKQTQKNQKQELKQLSAHPVQSSRYTVEATQESTNGKRSKMWCI
jgi:hypothetical protein